MDYSKALLPLVVVLLVFSGCSNGEDSVLARALDDIKQPLVLMDKRFELYENALLSIEEYLAAPGEDALEMAISICENAIVEIEGLTLPHSALTDEQRIALVKLGMNMGDYDALFQYTGYHNDINIETLTMLLRYLSQSPEQDDTLAYIVDFNNRYLIMDRMLEFLGLNALLYGFDSPELESFREGFLTGLLTLCADGLPWETELDVIEAKAEYWFSELEDEIDAYAEFVGTQYAASLTTP